jgi:hypothetical protein
MRDLDETLLALRARLSGCTGWCVYLFGVLLPIALLHTVHSAYPTTISTVAASFSKFVIRHRHRVNTDGRMANNDKEK